VPDLPSNATTSTPAAQLTAAAADLRKGRPSISCRSSPPRPCLRFSATSVRRSPSSNQGRQIPRFSRSGLPWCLLSWCSPPFESVTLPLAVIIDRAVCLVAADHGVSYCGKTTTSSPSWWIRRCDRSQPPRTNPYLGVRQQLEDQDESPCAAVRGGTVAPASPPSDYVVRLLFGVMPLVWVDRRGGGAAAALGTRCSPA